MRTPASYFMSMLILALSCAGMAPAKTPCMVSASADAAFSPPLTTVDGIPVAMDDCSTLELTRGAASVFVRERSGSSYRISIVAGDKLATKLTSKSGSADYSKIFTLLASIGVGDLKSGGGIKRAFEGGKVAGFPSAKIMPPHGNLKVNHAGAIDVIRNFQIQDANGRAVFRATNQTGTVNVPADILTAGSTFAWTLQTNDGQAQGSFEVIDKEFEADVLAELKMALKGTKEGDPDRLLLQALTYEHNGLEFDRDLVLNQYKRR